MSLLAFLSSWQFVLIFYIGIFFLVYKNKSKFEFQGKIIALYRTKLGIKSMKYLADKFTKLVKFLAFIGIIIGYLGMLVIIFFILQGLYNLIFVPEAPATLAPVIPGVKIPGSPIFVPFWYGMISLFIVIVIHEFSHGVVSKAYKIPVKSSGFVLFGPLPGAFVEPDEKILLKKSATIQNSLFAAGPFSNILSALLIVALFSLVVNPVISNNFETVGISFSAVEPNFPASQAGLTTDVLYNKVNDQHVKNSGEFIAALGDLKPGETISIGDDNEMFEVTATTNPDDETKGYIGVNIITRFSNDQTTSFQLTLVLLEFLNWLFILSLGLGLANLLPIGPIDGGRMYQLACRRFLGKKKGDLVWAKTSLIFLALILILLFTPIIKAIV